MELFSRLPVRDHLEVTSVYFEQFHWIESLVFWSEAPGVAVFGWLLLILSLGQRRELAPLFLMVDVRSSQHARIPQVTVSGSLESGKDVSSLPCSDQDAPSYICTQRYEVSIVLKGTKRNA